MKRALKLVASLAVTVVASWWAFHDTHWSEQWQSLRSANYLIILPYMVTLGLVHLCRALRWGNLLSPLERVPFRKLNEASAIGFMMLIVLPFRLGEFARPYLIAERSSIRKSAAMASVVLERITDGIGIAILLRLLLFFVPDSAPGIGLVRWAGNGMFLIFTGGLAFLLFALWKQAAAVRFIRAIFGRVAPGLAERAAEIVDTFASAMRQLPSAGQLVAFFAYSVGYWGINGLGMALLSRAFACLPGEAACQAFALTPFQAFMIMCVLVVGVMIPAAPGMVGLFQAAVKLGLGLFVPAAVVTSKGIAYANVLWLCQTVFQVGLGLVFMMLGHLSFKDLAGKLATEGQAPTAPASGG